MAEESWHQARLIPTSGITGAEEQERRATSALLAVMTAVREYSRCLLAPLGAPVGHLETFIEVPFISGDKKFFPDGLIRVTRGQKTWVALVEVKTGNNVLAVEQLQNYLDVAREQGFQALITISNEIPAMAGQHPTKIDKRRLRKVELHHWSWSQVLSEAVMQKEFRGVADHDQAWILGELIRYLEHHKSGALEFDDMGASWVKVRDAVPAGTLRSSDMGVSEVVGKFDALLRYTSLRLGRQLGTEVAPVLSRKEMADPTLRSQTLIDSLIDRSVLEGAIRIANAVNPLLISADLRSSRLTCSVEVDAPRQGRPATRVAWLTRQLKSAPDHASIEAFAMHARGGGRAEPLRVVRENPQSIVADPKRDLKAFRVAIVTPLGAKRGRGRGSFIDSVVEGVDKFYLEVVQHLKNWTAPPPKMRELAEPIEPPASLSSTDLSSQDGTEPAPPSRDPALVPGLVDTTPNATTSSLPAGTT
jgi:hypothetical protein